MEAACANLKKRLEETYDIPFSVHLRDEYGDPVFIISPVNEMEELFNICIHFRQRIRMIIEMEPQKYAAVMLSEMNHADINKRKLFLEYIELFKQKKAKVEVFINHSVCNMEMVDNWNITWEKFRIRATKITEDSYFDEDKTKEIVGNWSVLSVGMLLSLLNIEDNSMKFTEGAISRITTNKYERNPANRELCLAANGYSCIICGFNFEKKYGNIGRKFIHVHHIEKVASFGGEYYLDPKTDMIPVCPNCHAMLHRSDPPMKTEQLKNILECNSKENINGNIC